MLNYSTKVVSKQRIESFFSLGISISKIVELKAGLPVVRAFSQLMEEWEYVHSGSTMQSVKFVMAKNSTCVYPQMSPIEGFSDLARPSVYKFHNAVVYEHLQLPHIPFELDYLEVFSGLCVELSKLYEKLIQEECFSNPVIYDAIVRLDTRVKHHIINLVSKEVTDVCAAKMKAGTRTLRSLAGIFFPSATATAGATTRHSISSASLLRVESAASLGSSGPAVAVAAGAASSSSGRSSPSPAVTAKTSYTATTPSSSSPSTVFASNTTTVPPPTLPTPPRDTAAVVFENPLLPTEARLGGAASSSRRGSAETAAAAAAAAAAGLPEPPVSL